MALEGGVGYPEPKLEDIKALIPRGRQGYKMVRSFLNSEVERDRYEPMMHIVDFLAATGDTMEPPLTGDMMHEMGILSGFMHQADVSKDLEYIKRGQVAAREMLEVVYEHGYTSEPSFIRDVRSSDAERVGVGIA